MRKIIITSKAANRITNSYEEIKAAMIKLTDAFYENPNFKHSKTDWDVHYNAANEILSAYAKSSTVIIRGKNTAIFLQNIKDHLKKLETYRDSGLLYED